MDSKFLKNWNKGFQEFQSEKTELNPVSGKLFQRVKSRIFPRADIVFLKILGIHSVVGFLSLAICNQFGLNPFHSKQTLTDWFMTIAGHHLCMVLCGIFFVSLTMLVANFLLTFEEMETVQRHQWLQVSLMGLFSLAAFYFFGAELVGTFVLLWAFGAMVGGITSLYGISYLRFSRQ